MADRALGQAPKGARRMQAAMLPLSTSVSEAVKMVAGGVRVTGVRRISVGMGVFTGDRLGEGDGCMDGGGVDDSRVNGGGDEGDDVSYERGDTRTLKSSPLSLNSSTLHRLFLVHLAGGDLGSGDSAVGSKSTGWVL
jgi:hypothetical protein